MPQTLPKTSRSATSTRRSTASLCMIFMACVLPRPGPRTLRTSSTTPKAPSPTTLMGLKAPATSGPSQSGHEFRFVQMTFDMAGLPSGFVRASGSHGA